MIPEYSKNTNIGLGWGIALHLLAFVLQFIPILGLLAAPIGLLGTCAFVWGGINFARAKGYPGIIGFVCLLSILGLLILYLLPDQTA